MRRSVCEKISLKAVRSNICGSGWHLCSDLGDFSRCEPNVQLVSGPITATEPNGRAVLVRPTQPRRVRPIRLEPRATAGIWSSSVFLAGRDRTPGSVLLEPEPASGERYSIFPRPDPRTFPLGCTLV